MKKLSIFLALLTTPILAETISKSYIGPSGSEESVKIRTEAVLWVEQNVQGLHLLSEQKLLGIHYYISQFFDRLQTIDAKRAQYDELYQTMKPGDVSYSPFFVKQGLKIAILDDHQSITDFPEYSHWRGLTVQDVFGYQGDLRSMDTIDGEATRNTCLLRENRVGSFPKGSANTFYHEFGHFLHMTTLAVEEFKTVERLYLAAKKRNQFIDSYAAQSVHEYIAQGIEAYVAETKTARDQIGRFTRTGRADLKRIDVDLHDFIATLIESY